MLFALLKILALRKKSNALLKFTFEKILKNPPNIQMQIITHIYIFAQFLLKECLR
jgi:hypothetical protein